MHELYGRRRGSKDGEEFFSSLPAWSQFSRSASLLSPPLLLFLSAFGEGFDTGLILFFLAFCLPYRLRQFPETSSFLDFSVRSLSPSDLLSLCKESILMAQQTSSGSSPPSCFPPSHRRLLSLSFSLFRASASCASCLSNCLHPIQSAKRSAGRSSPSDHLAVFVPLLLLFSPSFSSSARWGGL